jgi:hypothetical protein
MLRLYVSSLNVPWRIGECNFHCFNTNDVFVVALKKQYIVLYSTQHSIIFETRLSWLLLLIIALQNIAFTHYSYLIKYIYPYFHFEIITHLSLLYHCFRNGMHVVMTLNIVSTFSCTITIALISWPERNASVSLLFYILYFHIVLRCDIWLYFPDDFAFLPAV